MSISIKIEEYISNEQKNYYAGWFNDLSVEYAVKVAAARARMMAGSTGNVKYIDGTLKEYRIDWGQGIRIYFIQDGDVLIVLLGGGTKNGQAADIRQAKKMRDEYFTRKTILKNSKKG